MAQVRAEPELIAVTTLPAKTPAVITGTGVFAVVLELSPSCPVWLYPQQYAAPLAIAHT